MRRMEVDHRCPQSEPFVVVRCTAHQHVGGKCMSLLNAENGDLICRSCPVYGTHAGACASYRSFPSPSSCYCTPRVGGDLCEPH